MAKKGLGRGLGAIFGEDIGTASRAKTVTAAKRSARTGAESAKGDAKSGTQEDVSRETSKLKISLIEPNQSQPRKNFNEQSLQELSDSIRDHGVLQPILVRKNGPMYEILVGERRWRAARMAGLKEIPAIIKDVAPQEAAEIALIENIQREDLGSVEEARAYRALIDEFGLTQEEVAQRVSKNRTTITNSLRLLQLDDEVLSMVEDGQLSAGHARAILSISGKKAQAKAAREVAERGLSVRETEKLVKNWPERKSGQKKSGKDTASEKEIYLAALGQDLSERLQTKVNVRALGKEKGRIEIEYYSAEELERLIDSLSVG